MATTSVSLQAHKGRSERRQVAGPSAYLPTLDGWRAIAILLVMINHDRGQLFGAAGLFPDATLLKLADRGAIGVDLFFGLSGFLICSRLIAEREKTGRIDLAGFYIRRCFRILPPYLFNLLALGALALLGVLRIGPREFASCLVFARNYLPPAEDGESTRHFWSLAVEEHFYLIWPGLLVLLGGVRRARLAAAGLALLVTAWRGIDAHWLVVDHLVGGHGPGIYFRSDTRLDGLFLGCWAALLFSDPRWRGRLTAWLSPAAWTALLALFVAIVYVPIKVPIVHLWLSLLIPLILLGTVLRPEAIAGRFLERAPLRWVGRISYSLYLWQQLFLVPRPGPTPLGRLQSLPIDWLAVFACALLSFHLVETPMIEWGRRLCRRRDRGQAKPA